MKITNITTVLSALLALSRSQCALSASLRANNSKPNPERLRQLKISSALNSKVTRQNHDNEKDQRQLEQICVDKPSDWYDRDGPYFDCEWYGSHPDYCSWYGDHYENFGTTANRACCVCGGGDNRVDVPMRHVPNTYCDHHETGGSEHDCSQGSSFDQVWRKCIAQGTDCGGVMWNSCQGATSDTSVNGSWKLMNAGQDVGTADRPTATCGGKDQALGHWDVFAKVKHVPNTYCNYYKYGGDGDCSEGRSFFDAWYECDQDGPEVCQGIMWNSCEGSTANTSVNGAWKLIPADQDIGECGGPEQALGHWDVFLRE